MNTLLTLLQDGNVQWVLGGTLLLGISSGILGSFAMLRRRSLMGDVLAHAALPGVCIAFILTESRTVAPLLIGAIAAGLIGTWCVDVITRYSRVKEDTAQALVLAVFFGFGIVLLTHIARSGAAGQSGLDRFLFGQAASLIGSDVKVIGAAALVLTVTVTLLFKEFKLLCFDPAFGEGLGLRMRTLDRLLMLMVVTNVAIGLQAVGVVLMSALLITPAAAARYWTERLDVMVILAALFGGLSGVAGTFISLAGPKLATGPLIVLAASLLFLVSLTFGTRRGLVRKLAQQLKVRRKVAQENLLRILYEAVEKQATGAAAAGAGSTPTAQRPVEDEALGVAVSAHVVCERLGWNEATLRHYVNWARRQGYVASVTAGAPVPAEAEYASTAPNATTTVGNRRLLRLTPVGLAVARQVVRRHRLWEMFLMYEADFAVDHVDRDADDIEHFLPADVVAELERRLKDIYGPTDVPPSVHPL